MIIDDSHYTGKKNAEIKVGKHKRVEKAITKREIKEKKKKTVQGRMTSNHDTGF